MKTKKEIEEMMEKLRTKARLDKKAKNKIGDTYAYGQYIILKWVVGNSSIGLEMKNAKHK